MSDNNVIELYPFKCARLESGRKSEEKCNRQCASCAIWWPQKEEVTNEAGLDR